jgi:hypothetical protein
MDPSKTTGALTSSFGRVLQGPDEPTPRERRRIEVGNAVQYVCAGRHILGRDCPTKDCPWTNHRGAAWAEDKHGGDPENI